VKGKIGIEELKRKIFESLKIIRVYPKEPKKEVNFESPFVLKRGTKLTDFVKEINEKLAEKFRGAKLYNKDLKNFKIVGGNYVLKDEDIVEIKI
jgi:ribosome-interacting GTPase 1